jgi:hypothetical protein
MPSGNPGRKAEPSRPICGRLETAAHFFGPDYVHGARDQGDWIGGFFAVCAIGLAFGVFLIIKVAEILGGLCFTEMVLLISAKKWVGLTFGPIFSPSSGHPAGGQDPGNLESILRTYSPSDCLEPILRPLQQQPQLWRFSLECF